MSEKAPNLAVGDEVQFVHGPSHISGIVSGLDADGVMVCMLIGGNYQIRGPFQPADLAKAPRGEVAS